MRKILRNNNKMIKCKMMMMMMMMMMMISMKRMKIAVNKEKRPDLQN